MADTTIADRIRHILERLGWSQRELGRRAGLAETHVGLILRKFKDEPDASLENKTVRALAQAAGVSPEWLEYGTGDPGWLEEPPQVSPDVPVSDQVPPTYEQIPGYQAMEEQARQIEPKNPEWPYVQFRVANPLRDSSVPLTPASIAAMVKLIATYGIAPANARTNRPK